MGCELKQAAGGWAGTMSARRELRRVDNPSIWNLLHGAKAGPHGGFDAWQTPPRAPKSPSVARFAYAGKNSASPSKTSGSSSVTTGWISHIENGRANPAYGTADRLARALAWRLSQLVILAESIETEDRKPLDQPLREPRRRV